MPARAGGRFTEIGRAKGASSVVLGVAGGYCAGKDTVVRILEEAGYPSIDVDAVGHRVLRERGDAVAEAFGARVRDDP